MFTKLFLSLFLFFGAVLHASDGKPTLVVTLEAGESILIRSKECDKCMLIKYKDRDIRSKGMSFDESYVIEYEFIYYQCLSCGEHVIVGRACSNSYCPSNWD